MRHATAQHLDFQDTWLASPPEATDPIAQMADADRADWRLLRLVLCTAIAMLVLAVAGSLSLQH